MTNYIKATDFASKDSLPSGNANKVIRGSEINTEFNSIQTAVATKADLNSPSFTGLPTVPTAPLGTNTFQAASTQFVRSEVALTQSTSAITGGSITNTTITGLPTDLAVADGGTGVSTLPLNAVLIGNGTSPLLSVAPSTANNVLTSNGTVWLSQPIPQGFGEGQTWQSFTIGTQRVFGTTYTNTSGKPIFVGSMMPPSSNGTITVGGVLVSQTFAPAASNISFGAVVPNGATYVISNGSNFWVELR